MSSGYARVMWLWTIVGVVGAIAVTGGLAVFALHRQDRKLRSVPRVAIRDLVEGARVRVVGVPRTEAALLASPYTKTPCIGFRAEQSATTGGGEAKTVHKAKPVQEVLAFQLDDGTGAVAIDVALSELVLVPSLMKAEELQGKVFGARMVARGATSSSYIEYVLPAEQQVAVIGVVRRDADGTLKLGAPPRARLVVSNLRAALE